MRDYALTQARATGAIGFSLTTLFANWQARRDIAKLVTTAPSARLASRAKT